MPCHIPNLFTPTPLPHTYSFCPNPPRHTLIKLTPTHTSTCLLTSPNLPLHIFTSFTPTWPAIYLPALPPTCPAIYLYASPQPTLPHLYPPSPDLPQHRPFPNWYQLVTPHTYPSCPNWPHIPNDLTQTHLETCLPWYPKLPCHTLMHFLTSCPTTLLSTLPQAATPHDYPPCLNPSHHMPNCPSPNSIYLHLYLLPTLQQRYPRHFKPPQDTFVPCSILTHYTPTHATLICPSPVFPPHPNCPSTHQPNPYLSCPNPHLHIPTRSTSHLPASPQPALPHAYPPYSSLSHHIPMSLNQMCPFTCLPDILLPSISRAYPLQPNPLCHPTACYVRLTCPATRLTNSPQPTHNVPIYLALTQICKCLTNTAPTLLATHLQPRPTPTLHMFTCLAQT